jgi:hypothetical protein
MAAVTGQQVATLRAALTLDQAHVQAGRTRLPESGRPCWFQRAALRGVPARGPPPFRPGVDSRRRGAVRGQHPGRRPAGDDIDPVAAEALILRALGAGQPLHASPEAKVAVQAIVLGALIADLGLDTGELEEFLVQARCPRAR